jgi:subtilisin family serine protease
VNGTSLAAPLAAGACALILQTDTTLKPIQLRDRLWQTAYGVASPDTLKGYGIVDATRAAGFNYALVETEEKIFAFPNPFEDNLTVLVKVPQSSQVQFSIFNTAGEKVLKTDPSLYDSENYVFFWKGKNERNEEVASGLYLVKVDIDGNSEIIKVFKSK